MKNRILALLLVVLMVAGLFPFTALAACNHNNWNEASDKSYHFCKTSGCGEKCYGSVTREIIVNCSNNQGKKVYQLGCTECSYLRVNKYNAEGIDHAFSNGKCTACGADDPDYCEHDWNTDGTCKNGCGETCSHDYKRTTPECGPNKSITEECSICGNWVVIGPAATDHSLPEGATGSVQCTTCGATVEVKEPCTNHVWGSDGKCTNDDCDEECPHTESELVYRNCVESEYDNMACKACGVVTNRAVVKERTTHTYGEGDKCTYCGADKPEEDCNHEWDRLDGNCDKCGEPHDHDYQDIIPNCTQGGYLSQHCEGCGHTIVGNAVEKKNHNYGADGVCTVCGNVKSECAHEWNWATGQCEKCQEYHIHSDADITIDHPDCTEGGYIREICDVCGYILVKGHFPAGEHEYVNGICIRCGDVEPVEPEEDEPTVEETPKKASTEGLDDVPQTGSFFLEWLYNLIF